MFDHKCMEKLEAYKAQLKDPQYRVRFEEPVNGELAVKFVSWDAMNDWVAKYVPGKLMNYTIFRAVNRWVWKEIMKVNAEKGEV